MATAIAETHRRLDKLEDLRKRGVEPFSTYRPEHRTLVAEVVKFVVEGSTWNSDESPIFQLAGRVIRRRRCRGGVLLGLRDRSGTISLQVTQDGGMHPDVLDCDIGDVISVSGRPQAATGGKSGLIVVSGELLAKAMKLNYGLLQDGAASQIEELYLMESDERRQLFAKRAAIINALREWLHSEEFIEVETPSFEFLRGGSTVRPFLTHHRARNVEVSLRSSTELYLRRCTVGDLERVYNLGRRFRNEGMSPKHSPEFTMLEWSMAYSTYEDAASIAEFIVAHAAERALGRQQVTFRDREIDLKPPWRRISLRNAVLERTGLDILAATAKQVQEILPNGPTGPISWSDAVQRLYADQVETELIQPTVVFDFPLDVHPCQRANAADERLGEGFDIVLGGIEIGSGGTELSDPDEQCHRFAEQRRRQSKEDSLEPHPADQEYVNALQFGAPPSSGAGIGIDRLIMILLGGNAIAEIMPFSPTR